MSLELYVYHLQKNYWKYLNKSIIWPHNETFAKEGVDEHRGKTVIDINELPLIERMVGYFM
jgi:hypothetical protein